MGATGLDNTERDIPARNKVGGTKHHSGSESSLHICNCTVVSFIAMRIEVRDISVLRRLDHCDDGVRLCILAGNQRSSHRRDDTDVEKALVLEERYAFKCR